MGYQGMSTKGMTRYSVFQDLEAQQPDHYWVATSEDHKYLSGIGNTPVIALAELLFVIEAAQGEG